MSVYDTLCRQLSVILDIPIDRVHEEDFFRNECYLTQHVLDNCQDKPDFNKESDYKFEYWNGDLPATQAECNCFTRIRYNFVCVFRETDTPFILGSTCIKRLDPGAFLVECLDKNCTKLVKTGFCSLHKRKCPCGRIHKNNSICYCYVCNKKAKIEHGSDRCNRCSFDKYY